MAGAVTVVGADRLARTFHEMADELRHLDDTHRRAGAELATAAAQNVHRVTGALAGSIKVTVTRDGPAVSAGNAQVRYAGPIEGGWRRRHITPQRYMGRALDSRSGAVIDEYERAVVHAARQVKGA